MKYFQNINHKSREFLAVRTGMPAGAKGVQTLYQDGLPEGTIVKGGEILQWKTNGWKTIENELYLYGDNFKGTELSEIDNMSSRSVFTFLQRLQAALSTVEEHGVILPPISMRSVLFLEDGGVLFIPRRLAEIMHTYMDPEQASREVDILSHPAADENYMRYSFAICSLLYRFLCGREPFPVHESVERTNALSYTPLIPIKLFQPQISSSIDSSIIQALKKPREFSVRREQLSELMQEIGRQITDSQLHFPPDTNEKIERLQKRNLGIQRSRSFLYVHKAKFTVVSVALAIILLLSTLGDGASDEQHDYSQLEAVEVVELFYDSFNTLDHMAMEEITARNVGRADIRAVMFLYITSRVQTAYSHSENIINPAQYQQGLIPDASQTIYGISDLKIEIIESNPDSHLYSVSYILWAPHTGSDLDEDFEASLLSPPEIERLARKDTVRLEFSQDRWLITEILRISEEELPILKIEPAVRQ
ncbi:hypothetical protein [Spirochaeta dissipatitropha]